MGRDSILDEADQSREQNEQESDPSDSAEESDTEGDGDDRKRVTQRIPMDLVAEIDEVKKQYHLPSRNAAINFILAQGTDQLLGEGGAQ
jgi:hypothetical protein